MLKAIVVTNNTKYSQLSNYGGYPLLVLSHIYEGFKSDDRFFDFFKKSTLNMLDPSSFGLNVHKNNNELDDAIAYLLNKGYEDITVFSEMFVDSSFALSCLLLLKKYKNINLTFESEKEIIQYFETGKHIIEKDKWDYISICPLSKAVVSLDFTVEQINRFKIDETTGPINKIKFYKNIALLTVDDGAVLVIRKMGEKDENTIDDI